MRKFLKGLFSFLIVTIFISIVLSISLYLSYRDYLNHKYVEEELKIIVEDEIKVYLNQNYQLTPRLINGNKEIEDGQYRYEANNNLISISENGCINVEEMPENECIITITETNYNIQKNIKIKVINELSNIFRINQLFEGTMIYDEKYQFEIKNLQSGLDITNFVSFKTFDKNNQEIKNVLKLTIEENILTFIPIGLGDGTLQISVNDNIETFPISIKLDNEILTENVINNKLLSETDLKNIKTIYYTGEDLNISDLIIFDSLEDIAFENDEKVCDCNEILERYTYHVKENLFIDYYNDPNWKKYQMNIEPYLTSIENDKYVIYHDEITNTLECKKVDKLFEFKSLTATGYYHNKKWSISKEEKIPQTVEDILNSSENCLNLYAIMIPIEYKVEYHSTLTKTDQILSYIDCKYGTEFNLEKLSNHNYLGYTFVGWSSKITETQIINEEEVDNVEYNILNVDYLIVNNLTSTENEIIKLYDVWRPNKYIVSFERQSECENEMASIIKIITLEYNKEYDLINNEENNEFFDIPGYKITKWVTETEQEFDINNSILLNLSSVDNQVIKLTPVLEQKTYNVILKMPNNFNMNNGTLNQYKQYQLKTKVPYNTNLNTLDWYNETNTLTQINWNLIYSPTFEGYHWFIDLNNNNKKDQDEPTFSPLDGLNYVNVFSIKNFNCMNIDSDSIDNIIICPKGVSSQYYLTVNLDGGIIANGEAPRNVLLENENVNLTFDSPLKTGYVHKGWTVYLKDSTGEIKDTIAINSSKITINRSKINDVLLENLKNLDKIEINALYDKLYTLTFVSGGQVVNTITKVEGEEIPPISDLTKENSVFVGWDKEIPTRMPAYDLTINAKWLALTDKWIASTENGRRDKTITDADGVYDTIQFTNINVPELLKLGYKTVTLYVNIDVKEINDGYQNFWIYGTNGSDYLKKEEFEHGGSGKNTNWSTHKFSYSFNLEDLLDSRSQFKIEYGANGYGSDDWKLGYSEFTVYISK